MYKVKLLPNKPQAPQWLCYLIALLYIIMPIIGLVALFNIDNMLLVIGIGVDIVIGFGLFMCSRKFSWYCSGDLCVGKGIIEYDVLEVLDMMGSSKTRYKLVEVTGYRRKGNMLEVYGSGTVKEIVGKPKNIKKLQILDCTDEAEKYIMEEFKC